MTSPELLLTGDRQRWVEERREERGGTQGEDVRIIDDPFVCFAAEDFESIAACGRPCQAPAASAQEEEMSSRMWEMLKNLISQCGFLSKCIFFVSTLDSDVFHQLY